MNSPDARGLGADPLSDPSCPQPIAPGSPGGFSIKARICYLTDALLAVLACAVMGSGLIMEFVLGCRRGPGCARFGDFAEETVLWMDFETWATVHFYLAITLGLLAALHLALHWGLILSVVRRLIAGRPARFISALLFAALCVLLCPDSPAPLNPAGGQAYNAP